MTTLFKFLARARAAAIPRPKLLLLDTFLGEVIPRDNFRRSVFFRAGVRVFNATDDRAIRICVHMRKRGYTGTRA